MDFKTFLHYQGFLETPLLWFDDDVFSLKQFKNDDFKIESHYQLEFQNRRLGKLTEAFTCHQLKQNRNIGWIAENLQIQNGKQTIGELDALFHYKSQTIHLEIVYKFYLFDTIQTYADPLAYWIGPNRKDTLIYKLQKLKGKQLPLLLNKYCEPYLNKFNLKAENINQYVSFKAQLFFPYQVDTIQLDSLNRSCISGFHLSFNKIETLKDFKMYMPSKLDWLIIPHNEVNWLGFDEAKLNIKKEITNQRSPMIWLKDKNNQLKKGFITFW
ncbi:DUF1853 family protein [Winogradskyella ursingii]|uniref:DUF1853 family protein n=1 Tax=Winogradskyella ursingii TaxID=2686079 RepID=UPI0015CBA261|nr:DUF1853 family protein [Winogradskyella ursingii]